jgi:hypothetical protein
MHGAGTALCRHVMCNSRRRRLLLPVLLPPVLLLLPALLYVVPTSSQSMGLALSPAVQCSAPTRMHISDLHRVTFLAESSRQSIWRSLLRDVAVHYVLCMVEWVWGLVVLEGCAVACSWLRRFLTALL